MDTSHIQHKLHEELKLVEQELGELGVKNKDTGEWEPTMGDIDPTATEQNEIADRHEEYEERGNEANALQARREEIVQALKKIEGGTYGICEVGGEPIEEARLEANPAATTCTLHA